MTIFYFMLAAMILVLSMIQYRTHKKYELLTMDLIVFLCAITTAMSPSYGRHWLAYIILPAYLFHIILRFKNGKGKSTIDK